MCSWTEGSSVVEPSTNMEPLLMMRRAEHKARDDAVMTGHARRWQPVRGSHTGRMVSERCDCSQQAKQPGRGSHAQQACSQNDLNCRTRERRSRRRQQLMRLKQAEDLLVTLGHYARMYKGSGRCHASRDAAAQTSETGFLEQRCPTDTEESEEDHDARMRVMWCAWKAWTRQQGLRLAPFRPQCSRRPSACDTTYNMQLSERTDLRADADLLPRRLVHAEVLCLTDDPERGRTKRTEQAGTSKMRASDTIVSQPSCGGHDLGCGLIESVARELYNDRDSLDNAAVLQLLQVCSGHLRDALRARVEAGKSKRGRTVTRASSESLSDTCTPAEYASEVVDEILRRRMCTAGVWHLSGSVKGDIAESMETAMKQWTDDLATQ